MARNRSEQPQPQSRFVTHPNQGVYEVSLVEATGGLWEVHICSFDDEAMPARRTEPGGWKQSLIAYNAVPSRIWWNKSWVTEPPEDPTQTTSPGYFHAT